MQMRLRAIMQLYALRWQKVRITGSSGVPLFGRSIFILFSLRFQVDSQLMIVSSMISPYDRAMAMCCCALMQLWLLLCQLLP
jgi:hypothetical protein